MRNRAEGAIPEISKRIEEMTDTIAGAVKDQQEATDAIKGAVQSSLAELQKSVETISGQIETSIGDQRVAQQQMLDGLEKAFNTTIQNSTNQLNDSVKQLVEAMQNEIESVVRTMAESLSGIAQKFVDDYAPLLSRPAKLRDGQGQELMSRPLFPKRSDLERVDFCFRFDIGLMMVFLFIASSATDANQRASMSLRLCTNGRTQS